MTNTPQQKAKELIETFTFNCRECDNAILSAQLAVDEMYNIASLNDNVQQMNYLTDIKKEIQKYESNSN
jgi:hypothetical protein